MIKRLLIMLILVGLLFGGIFYFLNFKNQMIKSYMAAAANPPQTVSTVTASYSDWAGQLSAIGTISPVQGVEISPEVTGQISAIYFHEGQNEAQGAPLVKLRSEDAEAKLKSLQASSELAAVTYRRDQAQFEAKVISKQTLDASKANVLVANANVAEQQALLNKKLLRAPFAGNVGIRKVNLGQYVEAGTAMVTLQALDSVFVDFPVPQQALAKLKIGQKLQLNVDAYPGQNFSGIISVVNPNIDIHTRNVQVRALLKNTKHQLLPGMFATLNIYIGKSDRFITLPQTVISFNSYGATVFVIGPQNQAKDKDKPKLIANQHFITTGDTRGDQIAILKGIKEGDSVVSSGQLKLRNGSQVLIDNHLQPSNDANPEPVE